MSPICNKSATCPPCGCERGGYRPCYVFSDIILALLSKGRRRGASLVNLGIRVVDSMAVAGGSHVPLFVKSSLLRTIALSSQNSKHSHRGKSSEDTFPSAAGCHLVKVRHRSTSWVCLVARSRLACPCHEVSRHGRLNSPPSTGLSQKKPERRNRLCPSSINCEAR